MKLLAQIQNSIAEILQKKYEKVSNGADLQQIREDIYKIKQTILQLEIIKNLKENGTKN